MQDGGWYGVNYDSINIWRTWVGTRQEVKALVRKGRVAVDGITAKPGTESRPDGSAGDCGRKQHFLCENGILDAPQTGGCRLCDGGPP